MRFRATCVLAVPVAIVALATGVGVQHRVSAAEGLSQPEAEKISSNIYIANCHPPQAGLTRVVTLGKPDPNRRIRERYGPVMVYPVQVTWTGNCIGHPMGPQQTDFYENVNARYTANYFKDDFGNWAHTPYVGSCRTVHKAYQQKGGPVVQIPNAQPEGCATQDTIND